MKTSLTKIFACVAVSIILSQASALAFTVTNANQYRADTGAAIPFTTGTVPTGVGVYFDCLVADSTGLTMKMEVELRKSTEAFTGTANYSSSYVASGNRPRTSTATGLAAGNYGWRYRIVSNTGVNGIWVAEGHPDFIVQGVVVQAPTVTTLSANPVGVNSAGQLDGATTLGADNSQFPQYN